jgi:4-hydroxybenzoate polyprenyltransferase
MQGKSVVEFISASATLIKSRKEALGLWIWATLVSSLLIGRGFPAIQPTILSLITVFFLVVSVYIYNDVTDIDADKNNEFKKDRPLPSGKVSKRNAMILVYISAVLGLALSLTLNMISFTFALTYLILFGIYSYPRIHLKKRFLLKELVITSGLFIFNLLVSYGSIGTFSTMALIGTLFFAIFGFTALPAGMDATDVVADRLQGVKSLASVLSWRRRIQLLIIGIFVIMTLTPFTYINFGFNMILPIFVVLSCLVFLRYMFPLMNRVEPIMANMDNEMILKTKRTIIIFNFVLNAFLIIGSINLSFLLSHLF